MTGRNNRGALNEGRGNKNYLLPYIALGAVVLTLSIIHHWQGDAIAFKYFMPRYNEDEVFLPFNSIWEIPLSMANHYMHSTGRSFSHALAQFFCGFAGQYIFAISNAIMWGVFAFLLYKMSGVKGNKLFISLSACILTFLLFFSFGRPDSMPFEPAHQIDYVWCGAVTMVWLGLYFNKKNYSSLKLCLITLFSFIMGWSNESFSVPVSGALLIWMLSGRVRTAKDWSMTVAYGLGTIVIICAPGNYNRLSAGVEAASVMHTIENLMPALAIPFVWLTLYFMTNGNESLSKQNSIIHGLKRLWRYDYTGLFFVLVIAITFLFCTALGASSGARMFTCGNMLLSLFVLRRLSRFVETGNTKLRRGAFILILILGFASMTAATVHEIEEMKRRNGCIEKGYAESKDGVVVISDNDYLEGTNAIQTRPILYTIEDRLKHPGKPPIHIYPESFYSLPLHKDTNAMIKIGPQAWIMMQSKNKPADFIVLKKLLPGMLSKDMSPRKLDFTREDVAIDSTGYARIGIYRNSRGYILADVVMERQ